LQTVNILFYINIELPSFYLHVYYK